eukprot:Awhi_evm1s4094
MIPTSLFTKDASLIFKIERLGGDAESLVNVFNHWMAENMVNFTVFIFFVKDGACLDAMLSAGYDQKEIPIGLKAHITMLFKNHLNDK